MTAAYVVLLFSLTSPDEKTKVEGCSDNVGTIELGREMDFATAALPVSIVCSRLSV